ncbi:MAG: hypothetical protein IKG51_05170 [Firmicutes bacterium]|nr:hypothetical protein [Bacillota bacterium]
MMEDEGKKKVQQERFLQKKLYDVTISLDPADIEEEIKNAALIGEFLFYRSNLKDHTDEVGMAEGDENTRLPVMKKACARSADVTSIHWKKILKPDFIRSH